MRSERLLGWLIAIVSTQGSIMLSMGSGNKTLPVLTIFAAFTSLYVTDRTGWFRLSGTFANLAASFAVLVSVYDFFELQQERQLLAIAYLLVYLQIVLLYQRKTERTYAQLHLLSLLQVIVAAALNFTLLFGVLLVIYLYFSLWTGFAFFVTRQKNRQRSFTASTNVKSDTGHFLTEGISENHSADLQPRLALLAFRQAGVICVLAFVTFLLLPRMSDSTAYTNASGTRMLGFTNSVRLGELGTAIENKEPVLRLWFYQPGATGSFQLVRPPMLRGAIVNYYQNGTWSISGSQLWDREVELPLGPPSAIRQRIAMAPQGDQTIFAIFPPAVINRETPIAFNMRTKQLVRTISPSIPLDFALATTGIRHRRQQRLVPADSFDSVGGAATLQPFDPTEEPKPSTQRLEPLRLLAEEILSAAEVPAEGTIARAEMLCDYLKKSPRFTYSLTAEDRDPALDPIVDFLTNHPRGHCEYFSSALTLMLRSVGIRSRMVIGFQGGEWNPLGGYYQIRQKDAHSWTEAYIPADELENNPSGAWLRLDPTPSRMGMTQETNTWAVQQFYLQIRNYMDFLWGKYVIQLDASRQHEDVYGRLTDWTQSLLRSLSWNSPSEHAENGEQGQSSEDSSARGQGKLGWWSFVLWAMGTLLLLICLLLLRKLYRDGLTNEPALRTQRVAIPQLAFYRQWERLLARYLTVRRPEQSPRQHAATISACLTNCGLTEEREVPLRIVDVHYAYAFGGDRPSTEIEAELARAVSRLGKALASLPQHALKTP